MTVKELINSKYPSINSTNLKVRTGYYEILFHYGRVYARKVADEFRKCSDAAKVRCTEVSLTQGNSYKIKVVLNF